MRPISTFLMAAALSEPAVALFRSSALALKASSGANERGAGSAFSFASRASFISSICSLARSLRKGVQQHIQPLPEASHAASHTLHA